MRNLVARRLWWAGMASGKGGQGGGGLLPTQLVKLLDSDGNHKARGGANSYYYAFGGRNVWRDMGLVRTCCLFTFLLIA